jgi:hypothetical protein
MSDVLDSESGGIVLTARHKTQSVLLIWWCNFVSAKLCVPLRLGGLYVLWFLLPQRRIRGTHRFAENSVSFGHGLLILGLCAAFICLTSIEGRAQTQTRVKITVTSPETVVVQAHLFSPSRLWSFRNAYAGVLGIAERIDRFRANGVYVRMIAMGEFRSSEDATEIDYVVHMRRPSPADVAHVSWLNEDHGFLMFADLLPQGMEAVSLELSVPRGWTIHSAIAPDTDGLYQVSHPDDAIFFLGRSVRSTSKKELDAFITGTWRFKDSVAVKAATRLLERYLELTALKLPSRPAVMIAPLPVGTGSTKWRAQTRGSTVLLLMDPQAQITNWKGQLEIIFAHEVLHLWVPNALTLRGDYDWFFEGFTLYTALLTALDMKAIDFREYLDTLARVYDSYISYPNVLSLIEASERRWTHPWPVVYDKGMLVAFLFDLVLRKESGGKTTLLSRYRELFSPGKADRADGNDVIIGLLSSSPEAADLAASYISGKKDLELDRYLTSYGLVLDTSGKSSRLIPGNKVDDDQKRLLKSLGY